MPEHFVDDEFIAPAIPVRTVADPIRETVTTTTTSSPPVVTEDSTWVAWLLGIGTGILLLGVVLFYALRDNNSPAVVTPVNPPPASPIYVPPAQQPAVPPPAPAPVVNNYNNNYYPTPGASTS